MKGSDGRMDEGACAGCSYREHVLFESCLPEGGVHDDAHYRKLVAEIEELKARERRIREMRQMREALVREYVVRNSSESIRR